MPDFLEGSIEDIAASIAAREQGEAPTAPEVTPAPETPEIQPQEAPEAAQPDDGVKAGEVAEAPAVATPVSSPVETSKLQPDASLEVAQRLSEADKTKQEAAAARDQYLQNANALVQQLNTYAAGKFADLKTRQDVISLMTNDPGRYNEFVIWQADMQDARSRQQNAQQDAYRAFVQQEQAKLEKAIPELGDPAKKKDMADRLRAYATSEGIPENEAARSATDVIRLHKQMLMAEKLASFEKAQAAQAAALKEAKEKAAQAPKVQQPGTPRESGMSAKVKELEERFERTGKPEDLGLLIAARGG